VLETNVVASMLPPKEAVAPFTNSLPVIVNVNGPTFTCGGDIPVATGIGLSSVTALLAATDGFPASAAAIVMVFGVGSSARAL
jgi:hypothetical protein